MSAGSIVIDLLMKTGAFETDTARAESIAKKRAAAIDDAFAKMGRQIAISGAAAGAAIAAMVVQTTNTAGEIINLSRLSGATTDEFQRMAAAAKSSLLGKCLYRLALAMPTCAATSSTVMASKPFSASSRFTACTMASSRTCSMRCLKEDLGVSMAFMTKF